MPFQGPYDPHTELMNYEMGRWVDHRHDVESGGKSIQYPKHSESVMFFATFIAIGMILGFHWLATSLFGF